MTRHRVGVFLKVLFTCKQKSEQNFACAFDPDRYEEKHKLGDGAWFAAVNQI